MDKGKDYSAITGIVGTFKEIIVTLIAKDKRRTPYGMKTLYEFVDVEGRTVTWLTDSVLINNKGKEMRIDETARFRAKIKTQTEYETWIKNVTYKSELIPLEEYERLYGKVI